MRFEAAIDRDGILSVTGGHRSIAGASVPSRVTASCRVASYHAMRPILKSQLAKLRDSATVGLEPQLLCSIHASPWYVDSCLLDRGWAVTPDA